MTVKTWLYLRPVPGTAPSLIEEMIPASAYATHGHETDADGLVTALSFQLVGEDREEIGQRLVKELTASPLVAEATVRRMRVGPTQRVRK